MRRRIRPLAVLLALLLLIPSCSDRVTEGYGSLSIRVSDGTENAKMISYDPGDGSAASMTHYRVTILDSSGSEVAKSGLMTFSGGEGSFTITNMVSGSYTIKAEGFVGSEENLIATGETPVTVRPNSTANTAIAIDTFADEPAAAVAITFELPDECVVDGKANGTLKYSVKRVDSDELVVPEKSVTITSSTALTNGAYTLTLTDSVPAGRFILLASYEDTSGLVYSSADAMLIYPGLPATGSVSLDLSLAFDADFTITDMIGHTLEVTGSGEYRASDDTVVITLTKALSASEKVLWYVDGKAVTPVANGSAYMFSGLAKGDRQIIGIVWNTETKTTIGSIVAKLRVAGTIAVSEKPTFVNYFDVPVVSPENAPTDGSSFWNIDENSNNLITHLEAVGESVYVSPSEFLSDAHFLILPNEEKDNEVYFSNIGFFFGVNGGATPMLNAADIELISGNNVYIRFDISDSNEGHGFIFQILSDEYVYNLILQRTENIASVLLDFPSFSGNLHPYLAYFFTRDNPATADSISVINPVCVVIDDYAEFWAKQGLETDEEIRAYLDSLPYESFVAPEKEESQTLTVPENLLADIVYEGEVESGGEVPGNIEYVIAGTRENINVDYEVKQEELLTLPTDAFQIITTLPDGTYYQTGYNQMLFADFGTLQSQEGSVGDTFISHKCYIAYDYETQGSMDGAFQLFNLNPGTADETFYLLCTYDNNTENKRISSIIGPVDGVKGFASFNLGFICSENNITAPPSSFVLNHPIVVDITANQAFFDALGLTTDEEIKAYLDTIVFENFCVATVTV